MAFKFVIVPNKGNTMSNVKRRRGTDAQKNPNKWIFLGILVSLGALLLFFGTAGAGVIGYAIFRADATETQKARGFEEARQTIDKDREEARVVIDDAKTRSDAWYEAQRKKK